jgi:hypothetical protein
VLLVQLHALDEVRVTEEILEQGTGGLFIAGPLEL